MGPTAGRVIEIHYDANRQMEAFITCPSAATPHAGQYLLAFDPDDSSATLGTPHFAAQLAQGGFWAAPPIPPTWMPGTNLHLVGPLGHGFDLPDNILRLGLVALGVTASRLMPLVHHFSPTHTSMTLYTDSPLLHAPASLEVYPVSSLAESLDWPEWMVLDLPMERLDELRDIFKLPAGAGLPCPAQVLVTTPMPCAGMAACGACAILSRRGWKLACVDGPVFSLQQLKW